MKIVWYQKTHAVQRPVSFYVHRSLWWHSSYYLIMLTLDSVVLFIHTEIHHQHFPLLLSRSASNLTGSALRFNYSKVGFRQNRTISVQPNVESMHSFIHRSQLGSNRYRNPNFVYYTNLVSRYDQFYVHALS